MSKTRHMRSGKIEEIIYARLDRGEDLLRALWDICRQNDVKTGVLLDATGSMDTVRLQRFSHMPQEAREDYLGIDFVDIPGPLEVSAHGIIGMGWVPDPSVTPPLALTRGGGHTGFGAGGFEAHETPYCHVHITVSSASQTVCGHLLEGSYTARDDRNECNPLSHFTVAIAKVSGLVLKATYDETGFYHDLVKA
jgi:predicted DNA-binding protein with PD1-like motif